MIPTISSLSSTALRFLAMKIIGLFFSLSRKARKYSGRLFFSVMPLHDHPNMCVFFRMLFGKLNYQSFDKTEEKFKYNDFSMDEYQEFLETSKKLVLIVVERTIEAKMTGSGILEGDNMLMVRPSKGNMHRFVAEENTCFFDICLPNYTADGLRRITYFKEMGDICKEDKLKGISYDVTPPVLPTNFSVNDLSYRGTL